MKPVHDKNIFCRQLTHKLSGYRKSLGITSNKVREDTDIDVNKIENCESNLTVFTLYCLLDYYGKSMSEFFSDLEKDSLINYEMSRDELLEISE
jgi:hypothetical protein